MADFTDASDGGWMAELANLSDLEETHDCESAPEGSTVADLDHPALAESTPAIQTRLEDAFQIDAVALLEGFACTSPLFHQRDDHLAVGLYAELSEFWSAPELAMAFLPQTTGNHRSRAQHRQSAEETLHFVRNKIHLSKGDASTPGTASTPSLEFQVLAANRLCDRQLLPSSDALWCVTIGSKGNQEHSFLAVFNAGEGTVRIENSRSSGHLFSVAAWHITEDCRGNYGGFEEARRAYGRGQWLPAHWWQDTFLKALVCMLDLFAQQSQQELGDAVFTGSAASDYLRDSLGFTPEASFWLAAVHPHIVVIQMCRQVVVATPTYGLRSSLAFPAWQLKADPTVVDLLEGLVADWALKRGKAQKCHIAAELHRRLAAQWPKSVWRASVFLKGNTWPEEYVKSVDKICSMRKMAKNKKIPPAKTLPASACIAACAPPHDDALYCVTIGFSEFGMGMAVWPHPRIFHTFLLYYDAARRAVRTENAWENRYSFSAWRDDSEEMKLEHRGARMRYGGGRWWPYTLFFKHFFGQLVMALESTDFVGARDHFENCFGVRVDHKNEVQGNSRYPWLLIEEVVRTSFR